MTMPQPAAMPSAPALAGFCPPDYHGGSILNLMSSLVRAAGGYSPHPCLNGLPPGGLAAAQHIICLVLDGLGEQQLREYLGRGGGRQFFGVTPHRVITTVFPATTAAAITTFTTGAAPAEHGILGWFLNLADLGLVSAVLPAINMLGMPMLPPGYDFAAYLQLPSYLDTTVGWRRRMLSPDRLPFSRFSMAGTTWQGRRSYQTLAQFRRRLVRCVRHGARSLVYAYWSRYDSLCHKKGTRHPDTLAHLDQLDAFLGRMAGQLAGSGVALLVTADHGLVDVPADRVISLAAIPGFQDCLAMVPSGDARQVSCFVRPARVGRFLELVQSPPLAAAALCLPGPDLVAAGVLGPGRPHVRLSQRVGDYVLLARDGYAMAITVPGRTPHRHVGHHGGMSAAEIRVPLFVNWF